MVYMQLKNGSYMRKQISRISVHQSSKVYALLVFLLLALIFIPVGLIALYQGDRQTAFVSFGLPFAYLIISYIMVAVLSFLYNIIAKYFGGVEFELTDKD